MPRTFTGDAWPGTFVSSRLMPRRMDGLIAGSFRRRLLYALALVAGIAALMVREAVPPRHPRTDRKRLRRFGREGTPGRRRCPARAC
jgi:hypothetical protein